MSIRISSLAARSACDAIVDLIDGGSAAGTLKIYAGSRPTDVDTAITSQTVLASFTFAKPAFGNAADVSGGGSATAATIAPVTAAATGTATFFRAFNSTGTAIVDGTVSDTSGSGDLKLSSTSILSGIDVTVVSLTATMPKGA